MLPIFLLILILIFGLNVLTWFTNYTPTLNGPTAPALPPIIKQENFSCNGKNQVDKDYRLLAGVDYSQRTNNYPRKFPDSCSAPRHEFLLDFYTSSDKKPFQAGTLC